MSGMAKYQYRAGQVDGQHLQIHALQKQQETPEHWLGNTATTLAADTGRGHYAVLISATV